MCHLYLIVNYPTNKTVAYFGNLLSMGGEFANSAEMRVALTSKWQLMKQSLKDNWIFTEESAHTDDELTDSDSDSGEPSY